MPINYYIVYIVLLLAIVFRITYYHTLFKKNIISMKLRKNVVFKIGKTILFFIPILYLLVYILKIFDRIILVFLVLLFLTLFKIEKRRE